jgi:LPXTG-motif cell wall-anchored protein
LVHGYYELTETIAPTGYVLTGDMTVYFKVDDNGVTWLTKGSGAPSTWDACTSTSSSLVTFKNASEATADDPETPEDGSVAATNAAFTIRNTPGSELPATGGSGTNLIYLLGLTFTVFAGAGLVMKKRRRNAA